MKNIFNFTNINHHARIELKLTMNEYAVAELIYHLSNNPDGDMQGWCYAKKETLGEYLGLSERSIHTILSKLLELKLLEKHGVTKNLRTTKAWYDKVIIQQTEDSSPRLQHLHPQTEDSSPAIYNNNINNNNISKDIYEDKPRDLLKKRNFSEKQLLYQRICVFLETTLHTKFTNYPKQMKAIKSMFDAGYTEKQINYVITQMAQEDWYQDKGFDLTTVMNQMPLYKAKARKVMNVPYKAN